MSMQDFIQAIDIIEKQKIVLDYSYPQPANRIKEIEKILKIQLPQSYRDFLIKFGSIKFNGEEIYGLSHTYDYSKYVYSNVVCATLKEREVNKDPLFPTHLVIIHTLANGEFCCLDTSQMNEHGECSVISWCSSLANEQPKTLAEDFGAFLLNKIQL
jgi:hypothetical protein